MIPSFYRQRSRKHTDARRGGTTWRFQTLHDDTPDTNRLYQWRIYNPHGLAKAAISRYEQPPNESHDAIREAKAQERKETRAQERKAPKRSKTAKGRGRKRKRAKAGKTG